MSSFLTSLSSLLPIPPLQHYFSNSGRLAAITPLDQLKRAVLPCIRPRLFVMFR